MHSLSARLLVLTIFFVMLSEVFIFVPSVSRFRTEWLGARMGAAHLAMLVVDAAPDRAVGEMLKSDLLTQVGAHVVVIRRSDMRLVLSGGSPPRKWARSGHEIHTTPLTSSPALMPAGTYS